MSTTLDIQHIVIATRDREHTIRLTQREPLYRFIWSKIKEKKCHLYRINGIGDHIHMIVDLHPSISKADFVKHIKTTSSQWMKASGLFPQFRGWGDGYFAESKDRRSLDDIVSYVRNQETHHLGRELADELKALSDACGKEMNPLDIR